MSAKKADATSVADRRAEDSKRHREWRAALKAKNLQEVRFRGTAAECTALRKFISEFIVRERELNRDPPPCEPREPVVAVASDQLPPHLQVSSESGLDRCSIPASSLVPMPDLGKAKRFTKEPPENFFK